MSNTNARFIQDLNRLVSIKSSNEKVLSDIGSQPIPAQRGVGEIVNPPRQQSQQQSDTMPSSLIEIEGSREYYEPELMKSSDGLFVIIHQQIRKMTFKDSNGQQLTIEFAREKN